MTGEVGTQSFSIDRAPLYQRTLAQCPHRSDTRSQRANWSDREAPQETITPFLEKILT